MKKLSTIIYLAILFSGLILATGCKKTDNAPSAASQVPGVFTCNYSNILLSTIDITGNVTADYGFIVLKRGFCLSKTNQNPTIQNDTMISPANGTNSFSGKVKGLKGQTIYFIRAFAVNINRTGYGSVANVTPIDSMVTDVDNNHYPIVQVGSQVWMAENLKATHYRNGDIIANVTDGTQWGSLTTLGLAPEQGSRALPWSSYQVILIFIS